GFGELHIKVQVKTKGAFGSRNLQDSDGIGI
ncbi:hypothetical protein Tco_1287439, partial [Tanacetum coccineum]